MALAHCVHQMFQPAADGGDGRVIGHIGTSMQGMQGGNQLIADHNLRIVRLGLRDTAVDGGQVMNRLVVKNFNQHRLTVGAGRHFIARFVGDFEGRQMIVRPRGDRDLFAI